MGVIGAIYLMILLVMLFVRAWGLYLRFTGNTGLYKVCRMRQVRGKRCGSAKVCHKHGISRAAVVAGAQGQLRKVWRTCAGIMTLLGRRSHWLP